MICTSCDGPTEVYDTRPHESGIRRRRQCCNCGTRFTTYETTTKPRSLQAVLLEKAKRAVRDRRRYERLTPEAKAALLMRQKLRRAGVHTPSQ
jgi:transcriptional regulator NrdR family protein